MNRSLRMGMGILPQISLISQIVRTVLTVSKNNACVIPLHYFLQSVQSVSPKIRLNPPPISENQ